MELASKAGVVAVPSSVFYLEPRAGEKLVRWTFCKRREVIAEAVERLGSLA